MFTTSEFYVFVKSLDFDNAFEVIHQLPVSKCILLYICLVFLSCCIYNLEFFSFHLKIVHSKKE